ncbi:glycoside hydrolase family 9 protein [Vibrio sp. 10N.261.55.A7]|uniref:glycoside hydrolase family 9 protein n=1 Tax=Vibrio sp. 10N.261.55.A7 TaxID=1880851 RepID=UPI000C845B92|nr:glycoside hydrolase family 9 protein [Vibrio sp. 10N.261.55.A7]PMJ88753.1 glycosyl hydrolase [Vibrio sp. 10N.261.55.A7]
MKSYRYALPLFIGLSSQSFANQEMLTNGNFEKDLAHWWVAGTTVSVDNGEACATISRPGSNPWDVILGHANIGLAEGNTYAIAFEAKANTATEVKTLIQHEGPPYTHYFVNQTELKPQWNSYHYQFNQTLPNDAGAEFQFQMGAQKEATVCFRNISIQGEPYREDRSVSPLRVNQVGFLPNADKKAFFVSESNEALRWKLFDANGINIDVGRTLPFGLNRASGEMIHQIDLSYLTTDQQGLKVTIDDVESFSFDVHSSIYSEMKYDALSYFYQNRSGIEIEPQYVQRNDLARPAGHPSDVVTCFDKKDAWGNEWPGCDFEVDVTGGWYDAGDHGKYTVNSGITTWTLLNLYERGFWLDTVDIPFPDGTVKIPENNNGVNDLLDEARWNIEFMLSMQIPTGQRVAAPIGDLSASQTLNLTDIDASHLVFHKVADESWTGIPLAPHQDKEKRYVGQPSTAATLNLAAIGAQCARIWKDIDSDFSKKCLTAAENAWEAANKNPEIYAYNNFLGSGPYDDFNLVDEFYWAATELFITTGKSGYKDAAVNSPLFLDVPKGDIKTTGDIFWQYTAPLATLSIALVPNEFEPYIVAKARENIISTAKSYQAQISNEGYAIPYSVEEYPWGSNSNLANRGIFLIYGHDFSGDVSFVKAAANGMDYLLGGNPLNISYVTGYGQYAVEQPHHRFWANVASEQFPKPAPGALIGGPNSISFSDPIASGMQGNCTGQTCFVDKIGAWTMNEITINWNAPLVWLTTALDEGQLNN